MRKKKIPLTSKSSQGIRIVGIALHKKRFLFFGHIYIFIYYEIYLEEGNAFIS